MLSALTINSPFSDSGATDRSAALSSSAPLKSAREKDRRPEIAGAIGPDRLMRGPSVQFPVT